MMKRIKFPSTYSDWCSGIIMIVALLVVLVQNSCDDNADSYAIATERFVGSSVNMAVTDTLPLLVGKDSTIGLALLPENITNPVLLWTSSDSSVATAHNGIIKAIALGYATITVATTDGSTRTSSVVIKVIDKIDYISGLTFINSTNSIYEGDTMALKVETTPAKPTYTTLNWTSSNTQVATVTKSGVVKGMAIGTTTITAKATDGSGVKTSIDVEVKKYIPISGIVITTQISDALAIGEQITLNITISPTDASAQSLLWTSSSTSVATVSNGVIRGVSAGTSTIKVSTSDDKISASIAITVAEGKISDMFTGVSSAWKAATSNSTGVISNGTFLVTLAKQSSGKYRGDFQRIGGATVHAGKYPIVAIKFNRPGSTGNQGNLIFDTNLGSYKNGGNNFTVLTSNDGVQVHYADFRNTFGSAATTLSTTATTTLTTFQFKVADIVLTDSEVAAGGNQYRVYWVKTFASVADLQAYLANE